MAMLHAAEEAWFDHYLKGTGAKPPQGVTAITQTCPGRCSVRRARSQPPTWDELSPGEVALHRHGSKTIAPGGGDPSTASPSTRSPMDSAEAPGCATTSGAGPARHRDLPPPCREGRRLHTVGLAHRDRRHLLGLADLADRRPPRSTSTPTATQPSSPAASTAPTPRAARSSSSTRTGGSSRTATFPSSSCSRTTARTAAHRTARARSPSPTSSCGSRRARRATGDPVPSVIPPGTEPAPGVEVAGPCESGFSEKGTKRNDRLKGTAGGDRLRGGKGNDKISGKDGDDCLSGGKGKDRVVRRRR